MKKIIVLILLISVAGITMGQIVEATANSSADTAKYWKITGKSALNFSQVSLTNWSEGGVGSATGTFLFGINANNKKDRHIWDNSFSFEYGVTKNDNESNRKSIDQIYLSSKYGYELHKRWFLSLLFDLRTQAAKGYNYPNKNVYISRFMAPGYMNFALGLDYRPNTNLSLLVSPISTKLTFVMDDSLSSAGAFGVDPGKKFRAEMGAYLKFVYLKKSLLKNVDLETRLDLFSNYFHQPQNIDVNWDVKLDMKINKYMQTTFGTTVKYDDDIKYVDGAGTVHGPRTQVKQFLGVGLLFVF